MGIHLWRFHAAGETHRRLRRAAGRAKAGTTGFRHDDFVRVQPVVKSQRLLLLGYERDELEVVVEPVSDDQRSETVQSDGQRREQDAPKERVAIW
jgi:hypothetical protein